MHRADDHDGRGNQRRQGEAATEEPSAVHTPSSYVDVVRLKRGVLFAQGESKAVCPQLTPSLVTTDPRSAGSCHWGIASDVVGLVLGGPGRRGLVVGRLWSGDFLGH